MIRWMWADSFTDVTDTAWAPDYPVADADFDCAMMDDTLAYKWANKLCADEAMYICQKTVLAFSEDLHWSHKTTTTLTTDIPTITFSPVMTTTATTAKPISTTNNEFSARAATTSSTTSDTYHVELVGGAVYPDSAPGNVFVTNSEGVCGPVCQYGWGREEAAVVCRQLGYPGVSLPTVHSQYGHVQTPYAMDNLNCTGGEGFLQECAYSTNSFCNKYEAAGVVCYK